ncbi:hypothetical protein [Paludisphaera soli]|uniref:hypothetical protein n=1 Tax=Paludisphaera soli TaxID=2712865 RepID=UPI0013EC5639|nr:hypothetical protein [Paludisphaera soli]
MSRTDLDVYNEACGFLIGSASLHGGAYSEAVDGDAEWLAGIAAGDFLPFELVQDDGFIIRVVIDEPLSAREEDEWVGRTRHKLRVPDGRLVVVGGCQEYLAGEEMDEFTASLDVPPGDYLAEVYSYYHGVNGEFCLREAGPDEPIAAYFRRTRPGEPFPLWLRDLCADDPRLDPGHEEEWRDEQVDYDAEKPAHVGFLIHLSPLVEEPAAPAIERGWIAIGQGARRPDACPLGLVADHLAVEGDE